MKRKQVNAILSDYGILCPTTSVSEDGSDSMDMIFRIFCESN
jgi:hypothetical protein